MGSSSQRCPACVAGPWPEPRDWGHEAPAGRVVPKLRLPLLTAASTCGVALSVSLTGHGDAIFRQFALEAQLSPPVRGAW